MIQFRFFSVLAVVLCCMTRSPVRGQPVSDFEDGTLQGWTIEFGGTLQVENVGNPGYSMGAIDEVGGTGIRVLSPAEFTGNLSGFADVAWDEYLVESGSGNTSATNVGLRGIDGTEYWHIGGDPDARNNWNARLVPFYITEWTRLAGSASFESVLENVEFLMFGMDTSSTIGGLESRIDNVRLTIPEGIPGDFDMNGRVDGLDFLEWQRSPNIGSLDDWEANYSLPNTVNSAVVPEPNALVLAGLIIFLAVSRRHQ